LCGAFLGGLVALVSPGCIDEAARGDGDVSGEVSGPECRGSADCTKFANGCNASACVDGACTSEAVVCDDSNDCTTDGCDTASGCVFDPRAPGSDCVVDRSGACVDSSWHAPDVCDDAGHCVDGGSEGCLVTAGTGSECTHRECVPGSGCGIIADDDGTSCVAGGRSDVCVEGVRYEADACTERQCVEAGESPCPVGFCEAATCSGKDCDSKPIGIDIDITGGWTLLGLLTNPTGGLVAARQGIELASDGSIAVQSALGPLDAVAPSDGSYCITSDGELQLALRSTDRPEVLLRGRLTRGRDLAVMTYPGLVGIAVLVKNRETSEARLLGGTYRIVGVDNIASDGVARASSVLGTIAFSDGCVTGGSYNASIGTGAPSNVPLSLPNPPSCGDFTGANSIGFDVRAVGDVRRWIGVVGTAGHYAVMQRFRVGEKVLEPSLVFLVRTGLAQPFALDGTYERARLSLTDGGDATLVTSTIGFDGTGRVTALAEGDIAFDPAAAVSMSTNDPISAFLLTLIVGNETRQRVGQVGTSTGGKVDWFVDVGTAPTSGYVGPVEGRSLQLGVRAP